MKHIVLVKTLVVVVIISGFSWQCIGAWQDSQTTDEGVHLTAGRSYWQTGDFRLNPEHPALFKLWAAVPLVFLPQATIDTTSAVWRSGNQWTIGADYLYNSLAQVRYSSRWLLFFGRLPMMLVWLALVVTVALWTWRRWGPYPSTIATALLVFDPNLLGHGHLVTNDVATAFAYLGMFLVIGWFTDRPSWRRLIWLATVFAFALLTKYSTVILWVLVPVTLALSLAYCQRMTWRWWWRAMGACFLFSAVLTWSVYGFRVSRIDSDARVGRLWQERQEVISDGSVTTLPPLIQSFIRWSDPATPTGKFLESFQRVHVPAYWYWRGFFSATSHNYFGHAAYLLGQTSELGWWYYFPVALYAKTPLLLFGFVLAGVSLLLARLWRHRRQPWREQLPWRFWLLVMPPVVFLAWSMTSHINIGVRHVFPIYVFLPLAGAYTAAAIFARWPRSALIMTTLVAALSVAVPLRAWPNTIGYFNALAGGTRGGYRYVIDSNLDWNQDIWRVRDFLDQHGFPEVHVALFGSVPTNVIFPERLNVPSDQDIATGLRPSGIIVISLGLLHMQDGPFGWLRAYEPNWRIGSSVHVYDFR